MGIIHVTDDSFETEVKQSSVPVLVDFWAEWCGPCRQIAPALEELSGEFAGRLVVAKVNIDENPSSPAELGVRGIPAMYIFKGGEAVANMVGARPKTSIKKWIEDAI